MSTSSASLLQKNATKKGHRLVAFRFFDEIDLFLKFAGVDLVVLAEKSVFPIHLHHRCIPIQLRFVPNGKHIRPNLVFVQVIIDCSGTRLIVERFHRCFKPRCRSSHPVRPFVFIRFDTLILVEAISSIKSHHSVEPAAVGSLEKSYRYRSDVYRSFITKPTL